MSHRLAIIAPYTELTNLARQVCGELGIRASIHEGDLDEGVRIATNLAAQGTEVIISRGGTATAIAEKVELPVVEIRVSVFDLIKAIGQAKNCGKLIGLVGFSNVIYGSKNLETLFDVKIVELEIKTSDQVAKVIYNAKAAREIDVVVGDAVSVRFGKKAGLETVMVTSGKEAIGIALNEALELASVRRKERARAEQLKVILDFAHEGIIGTDADGKIALVNEAAKKYFGMPGEEILGHQADVFIQNKILNRALINGQTSIGELYRVGDKLIVQNVVPVRTDEEIVGVVSTFQEASHLQNVETKVRQKLFNKGHVAKYRFKDIITCSPSMENTIVQAKEFSLVDATVLITGESGTGKEILAQSIHNASRRKDKLFVAVNCAAVPENLLESELFGYEEGAFTGARKGGKKGLFELAHKGSLFLDEIGELPSNLQARLLRVLQEKAIMRVGGNSVIPVDVRIIASTHRDLDQAIAEGVFRLDLFYRLNVLRICLPPLRERQQDIPLMIDKLGSSISQRVGRPVPVFGDEAIALMQQYNWPGNVRELENILERLTVLCGGRSVGKENLQEIMGDIGSNMPSSPIAPDSAMPTRLDEIERKVILETLQKTGYSYHQTSQLLGISRTTLWRKLRQYQEDMLTLATPSTRKNVSK